MTEKTAKILKLSGAVLVFAGISVGVYFALRALGITSAEGLQHLIEGLGFWTWIVFLLLQVIVTTLLCIIPGTSMIFIICGCFVFGPLKAAIICSIGVIISSFCMFLIGDKLGEKIVIRLVGKEDLLKAQNLLKNRSVVYLPIMFLFPFFPDDALCMAAGLTNMKYKYFLIIVSIFRPIGVIASCVVFYLVGPGGTFLDLLGVKNFRLIDWIVIANVLAIDVYFLLKFIKWLEKTISLKIEGKKSAEAVAANPAPVTSESETETEIAAISESDAAAVRISESGTAPPSETLDSPQPAPKTAAATEHKPAPKKKPVSHTRKQSAE